MIEWNVTFKEKSPTKWAELRTTLPRAVNLQIFIGPKGWFYGNREKAKGVTSDWRSGLDTSGYNVRMSMNGVGMMTFDEFEQINKKVQECIEILQRPVDKSV